mmetsp:Transcript_412/g.989  ORF Transcript_412/g.989 Transcript_412/m.989 type:complete len:443 (+) Transcript_412:85-1413(+)
MENSVANRRHTKKQLVVAVAAIFTIAFVGLQAWLLDGSHATANCNTIPKATDELNDPYENRYTAHIGSGSVVQMKSTPRQRAVVHMGIHKTGSTTIQHLSKVYMQQLRQDGYEMPWVAKEEMNIGERETVYKTLRENQVNFASCFLPSDSDERKEFPCDSNLLLHGLDIANRNQNLFVSAETFSSIDAEGVVMLSSYLAHWEEITIVIYYRRLHEYLASLYNEILKARTFEDNADQWRWDTSIVDCVAEYVSGDSEWYPSYTTRLIERLETNFNSDNIVVMNYHDKSGGDMNELFFCNVMADATHTCDAVRSDRRRSQTVNLNSKVNLDYTDLAYGAKQAGLIEINSDEQMLRVAREIQVHHETLLMGVPFKRECLPVEVLEDLWDMTLQSEMLLFPGQDDNTIAEMRSDFDKAANTSLCKVDVQKALNEESWSLFFFTLNE